ncbi:17278_t:CDS:2 [Entrophospora sp. SA101]|nr:17278_t:CDS:2 [Entrophospora sp. SA101]
MSVSKLREQLITSNFSQLVKSRLVNLFLQHLSSLRLEKSLRLSLPSSLRPSKKVVADADFPKNIETTLFIGGNKAIPLDGGNRQEYLDNLIKLEILGLELTGGGLLRMSLADRQRLYDRIKIAAKRYDNKPQPIYLTIVIYKRDIEGERIVPEFYCQDCAIAKHKEMGTELTGFSVLENGIAASMERKVKLTLGYDGLDMPCQGCYELDSQITNYQAVRLKK